MNNLTRSKRPESDVTNEKKKNKNNRSTTININNNIGGSTQLSEIQKSTLIKR